MKILKNVILLKYIKGPYKKSKFIKTLVRGNIDKLKYLVQ